MKRVLGLLFIVSVAPTLFFLYVHETQSDNLDALRTTMTSEILNVLKRPSLEYDYNIDAHFPKVRQCHYGYEYDAKEGCYCAVGRRIVQSLVHEEDICIAKDACTEHDHCNDLGPHLTCQETDDTTRIGTCMKLPLP